MAETNSYNIKDVAYDVDKEINRLKGQVELFWDKELRRYKDFGLRNEMSVVEFGSGPGHLTEKLLSEFDKINITSVEIDEFLVSYAKEYLTNNGFKNFSVQQGSILNPDLPDDTFDFAITRLVIEHLPDPLAAVKEVFRVLKPGGIAVFIDNDFEMHIRSYPHISELKDLYDAYCQKRISEGGDPLIGRYLPILLKNASFSNIDFEIIPAHSRILGDEAFSKSEGMGIPMKLVKDGFLDSKVLAKITVNWRNMMQNEDHLIVRQLYMCAGEKPNTDQLVKSKKGKK